MQRICIARHMVWQCLSVRLSSDNHKPVLCQNLSSYNHPAWYYIQTLVFLMPKSLKKFSRFIPKWSPNTQGGNYCDFLPKGIIANVRSNALMFDDRTFQNHFYLFWRLFDFAITANGLSRKRLDSASVSYRSDLVWMYSYTWLLHELERCQLMNTGLQSLDFSF